MADRIDVPWPVCEAQQIPPCIGIKLASSDLCLAHAIDPVRDAALNQVSTTGVIDARGVQFSDQLLEQVLAAVPRGQNGEGLFKSCRFDRATFVGDADFGKVTFDGPAGFSRAAFSGANFSEAAFSSGADFSRVNSSGYAQFSDATFSGDADFSRANFSGYAQFSDATFSGDADFSRAAFSGANFSEAAFSGRADFRGAAFSGDVWFDEAAFSGDAQFNEAAFSGFALFRDATFSGEAWFGANFSGDAGFGGAAFSGVANFAEAAFSGDANFAEVTFRRLAVFVGARFEQARRFGPVLAYRGLDLEGTEFAQPVQIEVSTTGLSCRRARFPGGVQFRLRWARVVLDDADFPAPSILMGIPRLSDQKLAAEEERIVKAWQRLLAGKLSERPQLLSLRRANVAGIGLSNVTAADCRFAGAYNLDKMRLEADVSFALAPSLLGRLSWEGRQVIAEERDWRASRSRPWGWRPSLWPGWLGFRPGVLDPGQIAGLYRALRKGREDIKDEPGAADFYYGEMEMRRRARPTASSTPGTRSKGRAERGILTAYWLVSGYGLRAWRALACLAAITALFAIAFHLVGFATPPQPVSYWTSLLYAFRATLSLTDTDVQLTAWGQLLQGLLRLTGPVLLGLALLALRGRVKR